MNGYYTFYTLDHFPIDQAYLVDIHIYDEVKNRAKQYPELTLVETSFHQHILSGEVRPVDCLFLFDVLLHQVSPDWREILRLYVPFTSHFLIYNPQYRITPHTVRLPELGKKKYFRQVPVAQNKHDINLLFDQPDEKLDKTGLLRKNFGVYWQWGITDGDLISHMQELGFYLQWTKDCGKFPGTRAFNGVAFLFSQHAH